MSVSKSYDYYLFPSCMFQEDNFFPLECFAFFVHSINYPNYTANEHCLSALTFSFRFFFTLLCLVILDFSFSCLKIPLFFCI
ncbi:uncharacterized protein BO96DRAFT_36217 [Aspergillus niger CBS 101883]|uniref:Uncharacterized protein n=2 Tax=Aspergillus TaxID=5052 RepID=A0A370PMV9_ASPPH|nr:uncharacterized protein BO96DRAFT_36217 [Aspergillus niger CBS 101883]PYH57320.1 hypothetical protein BO96DRAFT_36217 [Aspergillus niger CBS 101883]RDH18764.1 hypothetical protein M747DRAFT_72215 [Aspergillus niger ATCC 13496]RDK43234.1 hypothetical protein M752DRAFT_154458 [Aspergillus phoenicis ATCC 13157]